MEEKNDTSRNIIIAIIVIAIIAVIGYFIYNSTLKNDVDNTLDGANDVIDDITNDNDNFDEVGAFLGKETYGDEEATANIELVLNRDKTASLVLVYNDTQKYTGTYTKSGKTITFTVDTTNNTSNNDTIDNTANNGNNTNNNTTNDNNTINDNTTNDNTVNNNTTNGKTFTFTISDDDLYYTSKETNNKIKLDKVDRDTLQYINE